jgi:hypothetical protein
MVPIDRTDAGGGRLRLVSPRASLHNHGFPRLRVVEKSGV